MRKCNYCNKLVKKGELWIRWNDKIFHFVDCFAFAVTGYTRRRK